MHNSSPFRFLLLLGLSLGASAQAATKEIRYDESGRLLDPLPSLDVGDTLRIRVQIADPEVALQVVHQVRYTCGGTLQTAPTQDNGNDSGISKPFGDGASFDIPISEECGKGVHALEWYVDVASRGNHTKRLHLHRTIRLYQSLYKVATTPEMEQREEKARGLWQQLRLEFNFRMGLDQEGLNVLEKVVKLIATPMLADAFDEKDLDWAVIKKHTIKVFERDERDLWQSPTVPTQTKPEQPPGTPAANQARSIEVVYLRQLKTKEQTLPYGHPDTLNSMDNLVALYYSQGRYAEAEPLYLRALKTREETLGPKHSDTLNSVNNLAAFYNSQGRYAEAEPLYLRALATLEGANSDHLSIATSASSLADLYKSQSRYAEAEPLCVRALEIREKALGPDHLSTVTSVSSLGGLYQSLGQYGKAEPLYLRVLKAREGTLGHEHSDTLKSVSSLADLYKSQNRYAEAEPLYLRVLKAREGTLGHEHPDTLKSVSSLVELYFRQGRQAEAEPHFLRTLAAFQTTPSLEPNYLQMPWTSLAHGETRIGPEVFVINRQADTLASFSTGTPSNTQQLYLAISNATEPWKLAKSVEIAQLPSDDALGTQLVATLLKLNVLGPVAVLRSSESNDSDTLPEIPFVYGEPRYDVSLIRLGRFEGATQVSYTAQSSLQTEQPASISGDFVVRKARRFGVRAGLIWGQQSDTVIGIRTAANGETLYLNGQPQLELEESESTLSDQLGAILGVAFYLQPTVPGQEALAGWSSLKPYLLLGAAITEFQFTLDGLKNSLNDDLYVGFGLGAGARFGLSAGISVAPRKEAVLNNDGTAWELDERYGRTGFFVSLNADLQMARAFLGVRDSLNLGLQDNAVTANGVE